MLNSVNLIGRLTADPVLRFTNGSGIPVAGFSVAVPRRRPKDESKEQVTDFINIVAWQGTAEFVTNNFTKGQPIGISGRFQQRKYTDRNGVLRYVHEVVAENVAFAGFKREDSQNTSTAETDYAEDFDPYENAA